MAIYNSQQNQSAIPQTRFFIGRPRVGKEIRLGIRQATEIDFMWRLFNAFPNTQPRLEKTQAATSRLDSRRQTYRTLPPRRAFQSTVDYYEAVLPLALARQRFIKYLQPNTFLRGIHKALASVLPPKLF